MANVQAWLDIVDVVLPILTFKQNSTAMNNVT
jgi:hypothetical protein